MFSRQRAILRLRNRRGIVSRLRLVKLAFLLSREASAPRAGIYDFGPYQRGPFSFTLYHEMRALERNGWLGEKEQGIQIAEAPNGQALMSISSVRRLAYRSSRAASSTTLSARWVETFIEGGGSTPLLD
jgi:uncharacterized protein YwgA